MEPRQFQFFAEKLAEHGAFPAEFRSAISRAYYAAFHFGLNQLHEMGFHILQNSAHEEVYRHLNNCGDAELAKAASKLHDLRAKWNHADYELQRTDVEQKKNAKILVYQAAKLIESIENRCNGDSRNQIIETIKGWKKRIHTG